MQYKEGLVQLHLFCKQGRIEEASRLMDELPLISTSGVLPYGSYDAFISAVLASPNHDGHAMAMDTVNKMSQNSLATQPSTLANIIAHVLREYDFR